MMRLGICSLLSACLTLVLTTTTHACSICGVGLRSTPTIREDVGNALAQVIFYGAAVESKLTGTGTGLTRIKILHVFRDKPKFIKGDHVEIRRYIPVQDGNAPPRFLMFCDMFMDRLDAYRGIPIKSDDVIEYVKKTMSLDPKDPVAALGFYFSNLEHPDPELAQDAFVEFAKANDRDIALASGKYSAEKLRRWLDPASGVPEVRLAVYALLLGTCGNKEDGSFLRTQLAREDDPRTRNIYDGLLSGYIALEPQEGWALLQGILRDGRKPLPLRLSAVRALRYSYGAHPDKYRKEALQVAEGMILQGELADLAIEELRRWKLWDLTREILSLHGKKGFDAPIMERAIIRYALSCKPDARVTEFLADRRRDMSDVVKEIEEQLQLEKP